MIILLATKSLLYIGILLYAGWVDQKTKKIPNVVHLIILADALIGLTCNRLPDSLLGLVAVSGPLLLISFFGPMGGGDIKFMAANGFFLGAHGIAWAAIIGLSAGVIVQLGISLFTQRSLEEPFALGPYLSLGCMAMWLLTIYPTNFI